MTVQRDPTERQLERLREKLRAEGRVLVSSAAEELGVTEMTVRRYLQELEVRGIARRMRGGAVPAGPISFRDRLQTQVRAKSVIATKLVPMLPAAGAIGLDSSSTVLRLAASLHAHRDLTVLTNGTETFRALSQVRGVRPILTGGELEPVTGSLVGRVAELTASKVVLRRLFVSAASVDSGGTHEACLAEAEMKRAMARTASEVTVAADSSKLGRLSAEQCFSWSEVAVLVTELDPDDPALEPYRGLVELL